MCRTSARKTTRSATFQQADSAGWGWVWREVSFPRDVESCRVMLMLCRAIEDLLVWAYR